MEKVKKIRPPRNWESDFVLRIVAVIIAVIIWVLLSITQYPTTTIQIANVPVLFSLEGTTAQEKGLSPVNLPSNMTVNVEIKGMKYEIGGYTEKDLLATVDLNPVNNEGTYSLDIDVASTHTSDQCTIVSVFPSSIDVAFEKIVSKTFDLDVEAPFVETDKDLILNEISVTPSEIQVEGTEKDLEKIDKVCARVNDTLTLTDNTTVSTSDLIFYDKNKVSLPMEKFTVKNKNFDVEFSLHQKKELFLKLDFSDTPDNFDTSSVPYNISKDSIFISTPKYSLSSLSEKTIGTLNLNEIDLNKTFDFRIRLKNDQKLLEDSDIVTVSFDSDGYSSKKLNIPSECFKVRNAPSGKKVKFNTATLSDVTIIGPDDVIKDIKAKDLIAEVNLETIKNQGKISTKAVIYSPEHNNIWCYGKYQLELTIS